VNTSQDKTGTLVDGAAAGSDRGFESRRNFIFFSFVILLLIFSFIKATNTLAEFDLTTHSSASRDGTTTYVGSPRRRVADY
jgi:hypothetical protein